MNRFTLAIILIALLSIGAGSLLGWFAHKARCHRRYRASY